MLDAITVSFFLLIIVRLLSICKVEGESMTFLWGDEEDILGDDDLNYERRSIIVTDLLYPKIRRVRQRELSAANDELEDNDPEISPNFTANLIEVFDGYQQEKVDDDIEVD
ncbi:hypothetical protein K501DRAFT_278772 [Backusella circina FSU 941]|nr:hypothetical protein K501DRAFT_278772 [Backusella circina FSU 941]